MMEISDILLFLNQIITSFMKNLVAILFLFIGAVSLSAQTLTPETLVKLARVGDPRISPDGKTVIYNVRTFDIAANKGQSDIFLIPVNGGTPVPLAKSAADEGSARWRPDGKKIGFLMADKNGDTQLWEVNPDGSIPLQVTSIAGGISNFGYSKTLSRIWYSADVKLDKKPSEIYPDLPKADGARIIDGLMFKHWNAWHDYAYSHLFIASYSNGTVGQGVDIMPGERWDAPTGPFGGDEQVMFSPDGKKLAYTCKKLNGTDAAVSTNTDIYLYDLLSGTTSNLTEGMNGYDNDPCWSPDSKKLLWLSMEQAGYESDRNRLFQYTFDTKQKTELLPTFDYSVDNLAWSDDSRIIVLTAAKNATKQIFIYDSFLKSAMPLRQVTTAQADYNEITVAGTSKALSIIASRTDMTMPSELFNVNAQTGEAKMITNTNPDSWGKLKKSTVTKRMVKTTDGKEMLVWVIYPPDFDPAKKYPTLLYCQGGPQSVVSQTFSYRWNFSLIAAQGYIVVAPNRRGLPSFGEEWNDQIAGDWGGQAMNDLLSAIDDVSKENYVDKNRLGAVGASFGGYSVYWLAGHHNKRFKAFISHCGVFNLESEYAATEEIFFAHHDMDGNYWDNPKPKSFDAFSPHKFVQNWDTPILVIHNEKDFRVPLNQGMEAFTAAQLRKVPSRFLYFPDEGHHVLKPQNSILWNRVFFDFLQTYLK
jgi:dipeptidyl aminopeptidase/acylaminoacyl peptidase